MANSAEEVAVNAAVDTLVTAWGALIAAQSAGAQIRINFYDVQRGVTAATPPSVTANMRQYLHTCGPGTEAADNIWAIPGWHTSKSLGFTPLFFKVSNAAGDMASS
jgi:hypothetical protein